MPTPVSELADLPSIDVDDRLTMAEQLLGRGEEHWLLRGMMGYILPHYDDCQAILRDGRWHSALAVLNQTRGITDERMTRDRPSILSTEGSEHSRLRRLVGPAFTPKQADRMRPLIRSVIEGLVDPLVPAGRCEAVSAICDPYPIPIICAMVGAPPDDWPLFSRIATSIFRFFDVDAADHVEEIVAARVEMDDYVTALIEERRADPRDDILSDLIAIEEEGDRLSTTEMISLVEAMILAGTDTTRNQLGITLAVFAEHPDQWALLAEQPELASRAVEEALRYLGTVRGTGRFASEDLVYRDVMFPAGTLVFPSFWAANRQADLFDDAMTFDITAEREKPHLTFGSGAHFCLGAALARAELQEALVALARRLPGLRLDGDVIWKPDTAGIWGPAELPIAW